MDNSDTNPLVDSLVYAASLPLSWSAREDGYPDVNYISIAEHNEHVLRCANLLSEHLRDKMEEETEMDSALMRLEAKVNLLLELVSKLDQRVDQIPDASEIRLASDGIEWICNDSPPTEGHSIWVNLYIDSRIPEAMTIPARVLTVCEGLRGFTVVARYELLGEVVQEQMDKMIFRHHRRMIAQSRCE